LIRICHNVEGMTNDCLLKTVFTVGIMATVTIVAFRLNLSNSNELNFADFFLLTRTFITEAQEKIFPKGEKNPKPKEHPVQLPNAEHWHRATPTTSLTHVEITQNSESDRIFWLRKSTDY
jgi:hypothetical protein